MLLLPGTLPSCYSFQISDFLPELDGCWNSDGFLQGALTWLFINLTDKAIGNCLRIVFMLVAIRESEGVGEG